MIQDPNEHHEDDTDADFDDGIWCDRCGGDGMDPQVDHLLPCPLCQGEQKP